MDPWTLFVAGMAAAVGFRVGGALLDLILFLTTVAVASTFFSGED